MLDLHSISPDDVIATFGGIYLTGYADGTFLKATLDGDDYLESTGAHGDTTRIKNLKSMGEIEFTLQQSAVVNTLLSTHRVVDLSTGRNVLPFVIKDVGSGKTSILAKGAWIKKAPDLPQGDTVQNRTWVLRLFGVRHTYFVGGNTPII